MKIKRLTCVTVIFCLLLSLTLGLSASASTLGDVDSNGAVNPLDVVILTRYLAGWDGYEAKVNTANADLNNDGDVDPIDPIILARHLAGWQGYGELPYGSSTVTSEPEYIPGIW